MINKLSDFQVWVINNKLGHLPLPSDSSLVQRGAVPVRTIFWISRNIVELYTITLCFSLSSITCIVSYVLKNAQKQYSLPAYDKYLVASYMAKSWENANYYVGVEKDSLRHLTQATLR